MEYADLIRMVLALIFVVSLMGGLYLGLRRFGLSGGLTAAGLSTAKKRLKIVEILPLDARRRAMIIQRDDVQHLVLLSQSGETVIETNIKCPDEKE